MAYTFCDQLTEVILAVIGSPRFAAFLVYWICVLIFRAFLPITPVMMLFGWLLIDVVMVHNARCIKNLLKDLEIRDAVARTRAEDERIANAVIEDVIAENANGER